LARRAHREGLAATAALAAALSTLASSGLATLSTLATSSTLAATFALAALSALFRAALTPTTFLIVALTLPLSWVRHFKLLLMLTEAIALSLNRHRDNWFLFFLVDATAARAGASISKLRTEDAPPTLLIRLGT
jgi:Zn-dependent protease with chaperone function